MSKKTPEKTTKPDWEAIALEYETGGDEVTLAKLARDHKVPAGTVRNRAAAGDWAKRRQQFRDNLVTHIRRRIRDKQARAVEQDYDRLQVCSDRVAQAVESGALCPRDLESAAATLIALAKAKEQLAGANDPEGLAESRMDPWDFVKEANVRYTAVVKIIGPGGE